MSTRNHLRAGVALGVLLVAITPHRADAQFGALKQKMKEKLAQAAAEKLVRPDSTTPAAAAATTTTPATVGSPATASTPTVAKPYADADALQITPQLVNGMIKGAAAASAQAQRRSRPATITPDKPTDPFMAYAACIQKYDVNGATEAAVAKQCGTAADAMAKQQALQIARRLADARADSLKYGMSADVSPDSAGALVMGLTQRQFGILRERATAFLVISAGGSKATCMRTQKEQYRFTDAESAALAARRAELSKLFLDEDQVRRAVSGSCRKA
jgi:hypothetical protein